MNTKNRYFKGLLRCQFQTIDPLKVGNSTTYTQQSSISLEPRFRFEEVEEISEEEYLRYSNPVGEPFIKQQQLSEVEFNFKVPDDPKFSSALRSVAEIVLVLDKQNVALNDGERFIETKPIGNFIQSEPDPNHEIFYDVDANQENPLRFQLGPDDYNKYYSPFEAIMGKATHGKLKGIGYVKSVEYFDENNQLLSLTQLHQYQEFQRKQKCASSPLGGVAQLVGILKQPPKPLGINLPTDEFSNQKGCFGGLSNNPGCFSRSGIGGLGCMLPFMLLLLAGLLWWLMGMKGCQQDKGTPPPIIIHDTIKVEVQKIDTLTIVKTDTVSYVDSTVKLNFETVNLPNVQFITNSDVLLPSSASDLQKLAEYLIKNDSLNATILGHTDNVGKPEENLKLSQRRAESVKRFLSSLGVDSKRLNAVGKGDQQPKADNNLEEGRLMNRRVEVQLTNTEIVTTTRTRVEENDNKETNDKNRKKNQP